MTSSRVRPRVLVGLFLALLAVALQGVQGDEELGKSQVPSEVQCRPYIEKALKDLGTGSLEESSAEVGEGADDDEASPLNEQSDDPTEADDDNDNDNENDDDDKDDEENAKETSVEGDSGEDGGDDDGRKSGENDELVADEPAETAEDDDDDDDGDNENVETVEVTSNETEAENQSDGDDGDDGDDTEEVDQRKDERSIEEADDEDGEQNDGAASVESAEDGQDNEADDGSKEDQENDTAEEDDGDAVDGKSGESEEDKNEADDSGEDKTEDNDSAEDGDKDQDDDDKSLEEGDNHSNGAEDGDSVADEPQGENSEEEKEGASLESGQKEDDDSKQDDDGDENPDSKENASADDSKEGEDATGQESAEDVDGDGDASTESPDGDNKSDESVEAKSRDRREVEEEEEEGKDADDDKQDDEEDKTESGEKGEEGDEGDEGEEGETQDDSDGSDDDEEAEPTPEEELIEEIEVPENLRPREHINQLLKLDEENEEKERAIQKAADIVLRDLKRLYDTAIKPLETLYKYRDLSNRHFGDPEIFSKPLVLFMGPWSGGKSSIVNYLLDNEYKPTSLRTGAEPSPAYFNILMHGEEEEILDGTQLAADWTFSGLQKFGQGMLDRLRGIRLNNKLLEKVNIVEIPGILEIRKQVQRLFPFNDACQWFIDRADIIFLVYDPAKLDVGPETEAILDQLKGREYQTRIILNKADQVKPEELMRVQGALIWNISPLMSSAEPPVMYSTSLWSLPYEAGAPTRLLYAQERAFLRDLRSAVDKRVEHKIASARRFAVRVRNHAKMVDCYLTTYYNHKSFFGNKKDISDKIIENPQDYHIYEGLSTLTNISRYDLPDPDVYKDFFRLNALYDFQQLSSTCTYFRGCPINRLDVAIAYDLPELVGKYKKSVEAALHEEETRPPPS